MNGSPNPIGNMPSIESILTGMAAIYGILALLGLALTVFWIVELVDIARREFPDQNTKVLWLIVVLLFHGLGSLIYYFVGKPQGRLHRRKRGRNDAISGV